MKIVIIEPLSISDRDMEGYAKQLKNQGHDLVVYADRTDDPAQLLSRCQGANILVLANQPLPDQIIQEMDSLSYINIAFTGYNHVNVDLAQEKGILVSNAAGYSTTAVSEHVLGLTLAAYRMMKESDEMTRAGKSLKDYYQGTEIKGKTVGIIGTGAIGQATAELFLAFGAKVIAHSRTQQLSLVDKGVTYVDLDDLLAQSDIITLHLALNKETHHYLNRERLAQMKPTALLINCARGPLVDQMALIQALEKGDLGFAALDVFDQEPPLNPNDPLLKAPRTLLSPHIAYHTQEAMKRRADIVFDNIQAYLAGQPKNVVRR